MDDTGNTVPPLLFPNVAIQACYIVKPLLSNSCCVAASCVVIAYQRVYTPQYIKIWSTAYNISFDSRNHTLWWNCQKLTAPSRYHSLMLCIKTNTTNSKFSQHILETGHSYGPLKDMLQTVYTAKQKGHYMNTREWGIYIYIYSRTWL
jgi:hypothetical protein